MDMLHGLKIETAEGWGNKKYTCKYLIRAASADVLLQFLLRVAFR